MSRRDPGFDVYIVVADILIGFLCTVFLLFAVYVKPVAQSPPAAKNAFAEEIERHRRRLSYAFKLDASPHAQVHLKYGERLLFEPCQWNLSESGKALLREHFSILAKYAPSIDRVQIEGHADARPASDCKSLQRVNLRRDNWILSSLRALDVRDFLEEELAPAGLPPRDASSAVPVAARAMLRKIEAVGRGDLHPLDDKHPKSEVNRRIEITVHFIEKPLAPGIPASSRVPTVR